MTSGEFERIDDEVAEEVIGRFVRSAVDSVFDHYLMSEIRTRIYAVVAAIPRGRVVTYGQVAAMAGFPRHARQVGYALFDLPEGSPLPWHRVVNARGEISQRSSESGCENIQRLKLEEEGVEFRNGRVDLKFYRWEPESRIGGSES